MVLVNDKLEGKKKHRSCYSSYNKRGSNNQHRNCEGTAQSEQSAFNASEIQQTQKQYLVATDALLKSQRRTASSLTALDRHQQVVTPLYPVYKEIFPFRQSDDSCILHVIQKNSPSVQLEYLSGHSK